MGNRRSFLKASLVMAAGVAVSSLEAQAATSSYPSNIIYSEADQGKWEGKAGSHAPKVSVDGGKVRVETKHGMSERHYIVRHTLVRADGKVIGSQVFYHDDKPLSSYVLPGVGVYYATSFCNLHDFWVTKFEV